jgi:hypothetical protein
MRLRNHLDDWYVSLEVDSARLRGSGTITGATTYQNVLSPTVYVHADIHYGKHRSFIQLKRN